MDIERGSQTVTSSSPPATGTAPTANGTAPVGATSPAPGPVDLSNPDAWSLEVTTTVGLLKRLSDNCGTDAGRQLEGLILGQLGASPAASVLSFFATTLQWARLPKNIGWEGLMLSLLSWAEVRAPDFYQFALSSLSGIAPRAGAPTIHSFADCSMNRSLLMSTLSSSSIPTIVDRLVTDPRRSVGIVARQAPPVQLGRGVEMENEKPDPWYETACVGAFVAAGGAAAGIASAPAAGAADATVAGIPVGTAITVSSVLAGAAVGTKVGGWVCGAAFGHGGGRTEDAPSGLDASTTFRGTPGDWTAPGRLLSQLVPPPPGSSPQDDGPRWPWPAGPGRPGQVPDGGVPWYPWPNSRPTSGPATDPVMAGGTAESSGGVAAMPPGTSAESLGPGVYLVRF